MVNHCQLENNNFRKVLYTSKHNIINTSETEDLKMYTIYSPAHHKDGIVRETKEQTETDGPEFDGVTTEQF